MPVDSVSAVEELIFSGPIYADQLRADCLNPNYGQWIGQQIHNRQNPSQKQLLKGPLISDHAVESVPFSNYLKNACY